MEKIKNLLLFCGLTKKEYTDIRNRVSAENQKVVGVFSIIGAVAFIAAMVISMTKDVGFPIILHIIPAALFVVMWILNKTLNKKCPYACDFCAVIFVIILLGAGVFTGVNQSTERTTLLLPFFVLSSLLFSFRIIYLFIWLFGAEIVYLIIASTTQAPALFTVNAVNTVIFCVVGVVVGAYMMAIKYKRYALDHFNHFLLVRDPLTGVYNRLSFENELDQITARKQPVTICAFDINGLKVCNDTKGHKAGDELIKGSAECIAKVFRPYGKVFRTGGDEFFAILSGDQFDTDELYNKFQEVTDSWHGDIVDSLSVSCGIARLNADYEKLLGETLQKADMLMYEDKRRHYGTYSTNVDIIDHSDILT